MWALGGLSAGAWAQQPLPPEAMAALQRARVPVEALSVVIEEIGSGRGRLEWQSDLPRNPASVMKLLTTYAALDLLGPSWAWRTPVWLQGPIRDGVLDGSVVIQGSGDPKLVIERLWLMLRHVQQLGVREIKGDIVLDRRAFAAPDSSPAEFDGDPARPYNVKPDALLLNYKTVTYTFTPVAGKGYALVTADPPLAGVFTDATVATTAGACDDWRSALKAGLADPARVTFAGVYAKACGELSWPVAYVDPASYNARLIEAMWRDLGGKLRGNVRDGVAPSLSAAPSPAPNAATSSVSTSASSSPSSPSEPASGAGTGSAAVSAPSFEITSPPLAEVIRDINKYSNNVMAQQLFLTLGLVQRGTGSPAAAREALRAWAKDRFGESAQDPVIDNGSGLSRDTRVTARWLTRMMQRAWSSPVMPELVSSLPVNGLDGTARRSQATQGRAHLKTGSLRDVAAVAGFVLGDSGRRYVLTAFINHPNANAARPALDALVQWTIQDTTWR